MANPYGLFSDFECWDDFMGLSGGSEPNEGGRVPGPALADVFLPTWVGVLAFSGLKFEFDELFTDSSAIGW